MPAPTNFFKSSLVAGEYLFGTWAALASPLSAELVSKTGFEWMVLDAEHAPNDLRSVLAQLQAVESSSCQPVVRLPVGDAALIKQFLDAGAQTLLIPMIDTPQDAAQVAAAAHYPPLGRRGVGSALARSGGFGMTVDYLTTAGEQVCVIAQAESRKAMQNITEIAKTTGIDAVFFGPSDLAADMGLIGQTGHPDVVAAVEVGIRKVVAAGKPAGVLAIDPDLARRFIDAGATFVAIATDVNALVLGLKTKRSQFNEYRELGK